MRPAAIRRPTAQTMIATSPNGEGGNVEKKRATSGAGASPAPRGRAGAAPGTGPRKRWAETAPRQPSRKVGAELRPTAPLSSRGSGQARPRRSGPSSRTRSRRAPQAAARGARARHPSAKAAAGPRAEASSPRGGFQRPGALMESPLARGPRVLRRRSPSRRAALLQRADIGDDRPAVVRRHARAVGKHDPVAVRDASKMSLRRRPHQRRLVIGRRMGESPPHDAPSPSPSYP